MAGFLKSIIRKKESEGQLASLADVEWKLAPADEELFINKNKLTPEQRTALDALVEKKSLDGPKYGDDYRLRPPRTANAEQSELWDTAFPPALERLNASLAPLAELPWQYPHTNSGDYHIWASDLTDEQKALLENAPQGAVHPKQQRKTLSSPDFDTLYELPSSGRGWRGGNRLNAMVHEKIEGGIGHDKAVLANLPWQFDRQGNLVLDAAVVSELADAFDFMAKPTPKLLPSGETEAATAGTEVQLHSGKAEVQEILERRGVKLSDGKYVLGLPNTVSKIYDAPDGDTDRARMAFYEHAHDAALERHKPLMELPWRFDKSLWAFVVTDADLEASKQRDKLEGALVKQGAVYELSSLTDFSYRASGPRAQVEQVRKQLEATVPNDIDIADLADLPWKYEHDGLTVPKDAFLKSKFGKSVQALEANGREWGTKVLIESPNRGEKIRLRISHEGNVVIGRDDLKQLPYYVTIKRALEKQYDQFVSEHADAINSLPWSFELRDDIKSFGATKLLAADLTTEQRELVDQLIARNQIHNHIDREFNYPSQRMLELLTPAFEAKKPYTIAAVADLPWEHHSGGIRFGIPMEGLAAEHSKTIENAGIRPDGWGNYSVEASKGRSHRGQKDKVLDDLRQAIAEKIRERTPVAEITEEILSLPWQYGGRGHHGNNIVLDGSKITDEQEAMLKAAIPEIHHFERMGLFGVDAYGKSRSGFFKLTQPNDHDIAHSVIDAPYYAALQKVANRHQDFLIKDVAAFPWRKNEQGGYRVSKKDLTAEQQLQIEQVCGGYFSYDAERAAPQKFSGDRSYVVDPNADDQKLLNAIKSRQTALPGHS